MILRKTPNVNPFRAMIVVIIAFIICQQGMAEIVPLRIIVELNVGESQEVTLTNGKTVKLQLVSVKELRDKVRHALRGAEVCILVDGEKICLNTGNYHVPQTLGKIQIDCPAIKGLNSGQGRDWWGLTKDARFRIWPQGSPLIKPGTFVYPLKQKWLANLSQIGNEPTYVNEGEGQQKWLYYHADFDVGGAEGLDGVVAAVDGVVISAHHQTLDAYKEDIGGIRRDVVYLLDDRGWYYRYSHLKHVEKKIQIGSRVQAGQSLGTMGKEGTSGGWVHLHFGIKHRDTPSGQWASEEAYAYLREAYIKQYKPDLLAVARPHHLVWRGDTVLLDGTKSESLTGTITSYDWTLSDGARATGAVQNKTYDTAGTYSEILKVTDSQGGVDYDFTVVQVYDKQQPDQRIPTMQASFYPTRNLKVGDTVQFFVRSFDCVGGGEVWDFGDHSPHVRVCSGSGRENKTSQGLFAQTEHVYTQPGDYIVTVTRTSIAGATATNHLHIRIDNRE